MSGMRQPGTWQWAISQIILEEREPLGHIMRDFAVHHTCQPNAFLRVASDPVINKALELSGAQVLYGRHNQLFNLDGQMISEVVEILKPTTSGPGSSRTAKQT